MKKTQIGWAFILILPTIATLIAFKNPNQIIPVILISGTILLQFFRLTITVTNEVIKFSFGIGIIHGKYPLKDIKSCKTIHYLPTGWGIRIRPDVLLFNTSGNKAIELNLEGRKRKVWIGTNHPKELSEYINSKLEIANN